MSKNVKSKLSSDVSDSTVTQNDSESALLTLPDVPLLCVLQNVPLQSLIFDLSQVHPRFGPLGDLVLKQSPPQRLLLYIGDLERIQKFKCSSRLAIPFSDYLVDGIPFVNYLGDPTTPTGKPRFPDPEFNRLHCVTLDDETVDKLVTLMPAISNLEIVISQQLNSCLISRLIRLLTHWAPTLKVLKFGREFQPDGSQYLLALFHEMNRKLSALEHLTLDLDGALSGNYELSARELPISGQLKEVLIQAQDIRCVRPLFDSAIHRAGDQLTSIGVAFPFTWDSLKYYVKHPVASRFTLLVTQNEPPYELPHFPNRIGYTTNWHLNQPLKWLTSRLVSLAHLQYLELRRLSSYGTVSIDPAVHSPLPSVEILRIHFNNSANDHIVLHDHTVLQDPHWAYLFPSVQIVNLIHKGHFCAKCYPQDGNCSYKPPGFEQSRQRMSCLEQLLAPLTVLPSLRRIFYQRNEDLKNIAEFTGKGVFVKTHAYIY